MEPIFADMESMISNGPLLRNIARTVSFNFIAEQKRNKGCLG